MAQTVVQHSNALRIGSCRMEVGEDIGSLVNLGATRGNTRFEETWEEVTTTSSNAGELDRRIRPGSHQCSVTGELFEIDLQNLALLRGGIDNYSAQAAAPVDVTNEAHILSGSKLELLVHWNADKAEVGNISVTNTVGTTTYVRNTDYVVVVDAYGRTGIARIPTGTITDGQTVHVDYQYTPAAHRKLTSGGKFKISPRVVRLTNEDENGKKFMITIYKARTAQGIQLEFLEDENGEYWAAPINLRGTRDVTRVASEQLFEIYDEQGVS